MTGRLCGRERIIRIVSRIDFWKYEVRGVCVKEGRLEEVERGRDWVGFLGTELDSFLSADVADNQGTTGSKLRACSSSFRKSKTNWNPKISFYGKCFNGDIKCKASIISTF
jgi:hypothetical protein